MTHNVRQSNDVSWKIFVKNKRTKRATRAKKKSHPINHKLNRMPNVNCLFFIIQSKHLVERLRAKFVILIGFSSKVWWACHPSSTRVNSTNEWMPGWHKHTASCAHCHLIFAQMSHTHTHAQIHSLKMIYTQWFINQRANEGKKTTMWHIEIPNDYNISVSIAWYEWTRFGFINCIWRCLSNQMRTS